MSMRNSWVMVVGSLLVTIGYGYGVVLLFEGTADSLETLSWSFIMLLPYAVGALSVYLHLRERPIGLVKAIFLPWLACLGLFAVAVVLSFGMLLCVLIGVPILFPAASLGGVTTWLVAKRPKVATAVLLLTLLSPIASSPVEAQIETPQSVTTTHTFIDIVGEETAVWREIASVSPISEAEHSFSWLHLVGFPRPVAATLSHEGVGGVRDATFENGLRFDETITVWEHHEQISFTIVETSEELLPPPLNLIDGEHFDVLSGTYRMERLDEQTIRLHLTSEHYLGTRFNVYGAWWTDQIMRNLQNYILEIVKARVE